MTMVPRGNATIFDANASLAIDMTPPEPTASEPIDAGKLIGAAFRQENVVGSLMARQWAGGDNDPAYNAWDSIKGTDYEEYWDRFTHVGNSGQTEALKRQIDMELEDRSTIAAGGGWGVLASIGAGVFSPENLIPGGTIYRGVKGGMTVAKSALSAATAAALSTTAAEAVLLGSQELRTPTESAINIGSSALLGGALGAGVSAMFTKADFARLAKGVEAEGNAAMAIEPEIATKVSDQMAERLVAIGRTRDDAKKESLLYGAFYQTMAKRTGKTVDELLVSNPLPEVRGGAIGPDPDGVVYNQSGRIVTDTPEFQQWFGESKVRASDGKPLVVYHGTTKDFDAFDAKVATDHKLRGKGAMFFTTKPEVASSYAGSFDIASDTGTKTVVAPGGNVMPVYLKMQNPAIWDVYGGEFNADFVTNAIKEAKREGHDGIVFRNMRDEPTYMGSGTPRSSHVIAVFEPTQIKSQFNRGTFDPNDPRILFQPAYHGTPHIFDKFEWSDKTRGKGEGAQAFGDGLYFAGNKEVARYYREALTQKAAVVRFDGSEFDGAIRSGDGGVNVQDYALSMVQTYGGVDEAADALASRSPTSETLSNLTNDSIDWIEANRSRIEVEKSSGRLYQVDIPDDSELMAWDAPLVEQPAKVQEVFNSLGVVAPPKPAPLKSATLDIIVQKALKAADGDPRDIALTIDNDSALYAQAMRYAERIDRVDEATIDDAGGIGGYIEQQAKEYLDALSARRNFTGAQAYTALSEKLGREISVDNSTGWAATGNVGDGAVREPNPAAASKALKDAGIPGHRFLDGNSRGDGEGAYNYVIYDDSRVAIQSYEQRDPNAFPGDGPRGSIELGDGSPVVRLFESADRSTFLHETGHFFLESYRSMAKGTPGLKSDWDALSEYLGIGADGRVSVEAHEKFARSFEAYLLDGKAPSEGLKAAFDQFREWLVAIYRNISGLNVPINDDVRQIMDRMLASDEAIRRARDPQFANEDAIMRSLRADAGAAAREISTLDENTIAGRGAQVAGGAVKFLNPVLRILHSASPVTRDVGTRLFENPIYLKKNFAGVASDPAVETLVKEYTQGAMARAVQDANGIFKDFRKAGGQMDRERFNEAVGMAMRRGDEADDPAITKAAKAWRASVFDPLKDKAIEAGLLPKDVSVGEATSYFTRVYNRPLIEAKESEFKGIVRRYIDKSIRDLEFKTEEIGIGNKIVEADKVNDRWKAAFDRLTSIEDRLAGRSAVRRRKMDELGRAQQLRFDAAKDRPPAELWKRLRNVDANASMIETLRELRQTERASGKQKYVDKYPVLAILKRRGGVKVGSWLDHELRQMGVNPQSHPGLFKSDGGLGAIDNWPWDEEELFQDNFARMPDGYVDQNELLDTIRQEVAGKPLQTPEQIAEGQSLDALDSWASQWLDDVGLPQNTSVGDARAYIKKIVGAEKQYDELGQRINRLDRELEDFDLATETVANEKLISEAETANLQKELNALEDEILQVRDIANASPRVKLVVDYATVRRDLFKKKLDEQRLRRRVESLRTLRDEGKANDALLAELGAKSTDLTRALDAIDKLKAKADKLEPMVPRVKQELPEFLNDADRASYVDEVVDNIFNTVTGRNVDGDMPRDIVAATRGPLKERTFHIPDTEIEGFLESNVEAVARRYARTMASDIELTRTFGKADLKEQVNQVKSSYLELRQAVEQGVDPETGAALAKPLSGPAKEKRLAELAKAEKNDIRDLQALRDMIRGSYLARENSTNFARVARVAGTVNYLRTMGGVTLSSMADVARHVMVHGLTGVMRDGLLPLISNLKGFKMSVEEAKLAGAVTERLLNTRMATWADITDPYSMGSPFERFMDNTANGFSKLNGLVYWNDFQKSFASVITQNRVLRGVADYGKLGRQESAYLAYLGIDGSMAERIAKQFDAHGTTEAGGVRVAHTDDWDDEWAKRTYRAAVNKDVDSTIITKGVGDTPLFMKTPAGRLMMQFKGFAIASHQRALMRGLQERPMGFLTGTMFATSVGALIYYLKALESNRLEDISDNPGRWIAEGLDRSGLFSIAFEANNTIEKAFGIGGYAALAAAFPNGNQDGKASKYASRSVAASLLGPTGDFIDTAIRATNAIKGAGDGLTEGDIGAVKRMIPGATLPGIRSLVEYLGVPAVRGGLAID